MDLIQAIKMYINKMTEDCGPGMKVLLMDKTTTSIVSAVYSQSEILQREVYLFEQLDLNNSADNMYHMKCITFLRPTKENVSLLCKELRNPRYGYYYIHFSNIISKSDIKTIAESDIQEVVREVQEFYADFLAVSPHLYTFNISSCGQCLSWDPLQLTRCAQGIISVLLSLKKCPLIRFQASSKMCKQLSEKIKEVFYKEENLFNFKQTDIQPQMLILDRREDPVTPLLMPWTYQAMVHELLTINNNQVDLSHVEDIKPDLQKLLLCAEQDDLYKQNLYKNFGEIGEIMKSLIDEFKLKAKSHQKLDTISDMKAFVENYPQFKKMSGTVSKHVIIMEQLSNYVSKKNLLEVSELQQQIACNIQTSQQAQKIRELIEKGIPEDEASKLIMLYALKSNSKDSKRELSNLIQLLKSKKVPDHWLELVTDILKYQSKTLIDKENTLESAKQITKRFYKDLKGVDNIFTQYVPLLKDIVEDWIKSKLKEEHYPFISDINQMTKYKVQDLIVFVIGGVTYEESMAIHQLNMANPHVRVILGGSKIHNSQSFLNDIKMSTFGVIKTKPGSRQL
ncbi:vacuolar protein sorting-associated protein 45 [Daktulosphaira vitifoliae]|uniref:vacuolar protein sorting-associated protein 45 n=1 Tax=Daktulosphaira vitifoliae TaxID=58002 RepID=UPI0021A9DAAA|nr:vacuolar protein sorting-associated protein 45 [Daktulosphaira vitifoliae]